MDGYIEMNLKGTGYEDVERIWLRIGISGELF
jgi:hypothetical protein